MSQMNVVPYIDVMLVLLVIFMVTTPMFSPGIVHLASVGQAAQVESEPIQVTVDKDGNYAVNDKGKTETATSLEAVLPLVQAHLGPQGQRPVVAFLLW